MDNRVATWSSQKIIAIFLLATTLGVLDFRLIAISVICFYFVIKHLLMRLIFLGPMNPKPTLSDSNYSKNEYQRDDCNIVYYTNFQNKLSDLVVFIHGWESASSRFEHRMKMFRQNGFHTLTFDMRGHGESGSTSEWTAGKVIEDLKGILSEIDSKIVRNTHFYGHSLGGFITLGMQNERHGGWWKDRIGTIILESPMTGYSPVLKDLSGKLSFLYPLLRRYALAGFNRIHPEVGGLRWEDIDVPNWGLPTCDLLVLQAANDARLGRIHYDLLLSQNLKCHVESHLIESLSHSRNEVNSERDDLIINWINKINSNHSSS